MSAISISPVFPTFSDTTGAPLESGYIYIGTAGTSAETNQVSVYWDDALTIPASQPIRTIGGYPVYNGSPAVVYVDGDYSITVKNKQQSLVYSALNLKERISTAFITGAIAIVNGGTGADNAEDALTNLGAAKAGPLADSGITGAASSGANSDITSLSGLTTAISGTGLGNKIQPITASVSANALTLTLNSTTLDFRSSSLTSGTVNTRNVPSAISLVISSGSTLGTINAVQSRIVVLAIDNAGTVELAAVNIAGGNDLSETGLISTTAEGGAGGADSASVIYSTTTRTNVPYRVVGYVESTQATAGTWATAPSTIQGAGGNAVTAMSGLGYGQTVQNLVGSRALATTYYNTTGKPIFLSVGSTTGNIGITLTINGVSQGQRTDACDAVIPPGASYSVVFSAGAISVWSETRL